MDEYINREDALKIIDSYSKACTEEGKIVADAIRDIIAVITPTADVAPKSEVDKWFRECEELQGRLIELEKEVAREVIADMREQIQGYENIDIILDRIEKKYTEDTNDGT
jgi:hypothetical protein